MTHQDFTVDAESEKLTESVVRLMLGVEKIGKEARIRRSAELRQTVYHAIERAFNAGFDAGISAHRGD